MKIKNPILILGVIALFLTAAGITSAQENHSLSVEPFSGEFAAGSSFLEAEAGISAFSQVSGVNIDLAESAFKTVEKKTAEYIIGSIALDDYDESDDVHVYVDISGWTVAYYLQEEKASKIIDWKHYLGGEITTTKLETALGEVCDAMYTYLTYVSYYDFRCPNATKIMIVIDEEIVDNSTECFRIKVPMAYSVYDRTWSHAIRDVDTNSTTSNITIDGVQLNSGNSGGGWQIWEGDITPAQLYLDVFHEICLYVNGYGSNDPCYVAIMLIYSEPPE